MLLGRAFFTVMIYFIDSPRDTPIAFASASWQLLMALPMAEAKLENAGQRKLNRDGGSVSTFCGLR